MQKKRCHRPMITKFINENKLPNDFSKTAEDYFIPLAEEIKLHQLSAETTYFVGINGSQGSGKSTLSAFIKDYLTENYGMNVVVMSLDDFYFSREERQIVAKNVHPLFTTRGVPGTHNMHQAKSVINSLKHQQSTIIPRFNKATDNPHPVSSWSKVSSAMDIVIFEGWCWGVEPQTSQQLTKPVNALESIEDNNAAWRNHVNLQLSVHYKPLYSLMDKWVMLKAPGFKDIYAWRLEQEKKLNAAVTNHDKQGIMNEQQIQRFIEHYQRLTEHGLSTLPNTCDHIFELNHERTITAHKLKEIHA